MSKPAIYSPVSISDRIRGLRIGETAIFSLSDGLAVRPIASRIAKKLERKYKTKRVADGIQLTRIRNQEARA